MKTADRFYKSVRWQRKRAAILRRDGYMCQVSLRFGKRITADTVHHIFPKDDYPEYALADWNLIAVSRKIHDELHDRTTGTLTKKGMELLERTARRKGIRVKE